MPHMPHVTIPECPHCGEHERAVFAWENMDWYCFNCGNSGSVKVEYFDESGESMNDEEV